MPQLHLTADKRGNQRFPQIAFSTSQIRKIIDEVVN